MRTLILGGTGMLGHQLYRTASQTMDAFVTVRTSSEVLSRYGIFHSSHIVEGVDAFDFASVERAVVSIKPDAVVNCIGIVKQHSLAKDPTACVTINALLPHRLNDLCRSLGSRLVHVSTDCVFDGRRGRYRETDSPNATDLYGLSKALGEPSAAPALTLRTSIIGRELNTSSGLVEWFLSNRNAQVKGYTQARFSGLTTLELSRVIVDVLENHPTLNGLFHVASEPIDKHALLRELNASFNAGARIEPDYTFSIDRTLDASQFAASTGYSSPSWKAMIAEMASLDTPYDNWKQS